MTTVDQVPVPVDDIKVIIGVLAYLEAHLLGADEADTARALFNRLHGDLAKYGHTADVDDSAALGAITQRLHTAIGDVR
jgi:hypothetical protein